MTGMTFIEIQKILFLQNALQPRGNAVSTHCLVDASLGNNRARRQSHMGVLIFVNKVPIHWLSKITNTVEVSSFGSEFVA